MITIDACVERFLRNPGELGKGAGWLSKEFKTTREIIKEAKKKARSILASQEKIEVANHIAELETRLTERETNHRTGGETLTYQSNKPLSPQEIQELAQVDNITTFVDRTWLKSHKNDTWTYSINTSCKIKDFYSSTELNSKLKEIFDGSHVFNIPKPVGYTINAKTLLVYIGDDHCGIILKDSVFGREYSGGTYAKRLLKVVEEISHLGYASKEIVVVRMGDEMDGYNAKTTRYDHPLDSMSNKEQFDIYTIANKVFYDTLFQSGLAESYTIINLNNSNHSGAGFSYIANKALEFWIEARFPAVKVVQQQQFIDIIEVGNHIIGLCHGKDDKYMKQNMPLNLDYKTDLWLMDYFKRYNTEGRWVHLIKADLHKYNINQGKFGRYVNIPSMSSGSNWIELNHGDSKPGCLIEIFNESSESVISMPVWF